MRFGYGIIFIVSRVNLSEGGADLSTEERGLIRTEASKWRNTVRPGYMLARLARWRVYNRGGWNICLNRWKWYLWSLVQGWYHSQGEYFRCPPPIILIFGYVIEDRKIRNTCFFIFPHFHIWGVKAAFKVRVEKSFLWKNGLFENLMSQSYFSFKDTKFVHWHYSPIFNSSRDIPEKWFFNPNFERSFHPPNMKTGKNKKTRISYFSVLYIISKNRNDRRRTPKILSLSDLPFLTDFKKEEVIDSIRVG